jgi:hypothetical protein
MQSNFTHGKQNVCTILTHIFKTKESQKKRQHVAFRDRYQKPVPGESDKCPEKRK